jgi:hypothetical protein
MKSPLASSILLVGAVMLFISGAVVAHTGTFSVAGLLDADVYRAIASWLHVS